MRSEDWRRPWTRMWGEWGGEGIAGARMGRTLSFAPPTSPGKRFLRVVPQIFPTNAPPPFPFRACVGVAMVGLLHVQGRRYAERCICHHVRGVDPFQGCIGRRGAPPPPPPVPQGAQQCPATVPRTESARFNGICNRQ